MVACDIIGQQQYFSTAITDLKKNLKKYETPTGQ